MNDQLTTDLASLRIAREPPRSTRRLVRWTLLLSLVGAAVFAAWRIGTPIIEAKLFRTEVRLAEIALVTRGQSRLELTSTGYVVPQVQVSVASKIVGRVAKAHVREGSTVRAGDALFELETGDQRARIASAQARVGAARARSSQARAQLAEVTQQRDREQKLAHDGAVPQATADDLSAHATSAQEQARAADADVLALQAEVSTLAQDLANDTIRAPIDGRVLTKPLLPGDVVSPGTPMAQIADFASIVVETDVPEGRLHLVKPSGPCEIVLDAYPERRWGGEVIEVGPTLNRAKGTASVKVRFLERDDSVLPEMSARVSFLDAPLDANQLKEPPKTGVPATAVVERGGSKVVFVIDGDMARVVPVRLGGPMPGGLLELVDGPAPGTKVVSEPPASLNDGQSVKEGSQ